MISENCYDISIFRTDRLQSLYTSFSIIFLTYCLPLIVSALFRCWLVLGASPNELSLDLAKEYRHRAYVGECFSAINVIVWLMSNIEFSPTRVFLLRRTQENMLTLRQKEVLSPILTTVLNHSLSLLQNDVRPTFLVPRSILRSIFYVFSLLPWPWRLSSCIFLLLSTFLS